MLPNPPLVPLLLSLAMSPGAGPTSHLWARVLHPLTSTPKNRATAPPGRLGPSIVTSSKASSWSPDYRSWLGEAVWRKALEWPFEDWAPLLSGHSPFSSSSSGPQSFSGVLFQTEWEQLLTMGNSSRVHTAPRRVRLHVRSTTDFMLQIIVRPLHTNLQVVTFQWRECVFTRPVMWVSSHVWCVDSLQVAVLLCTSPEKGWRETKGRRGNWRTEETHDAGNGKGILFIWGDTWVWEAQDPDVECHMKVAVAVQNTIQYYHVIYDKKKEVLPRHH